MILYHGTSEYAAREALKKGLRPRAETGEDNWSELGIGSNPKAIYLTDTWACHYACNARQQAPRIPGADGKISNRVAVIEIDTRGLVLTNLRADEDYMAFTDPDIKGMMTEAALKEKVRHHARNLSTDWKRSLETIGNCVYLGKILPKHIRRVALFDYRQNRDMASAMVDGLPTPAGFRFARDYHRSYIKWLFGEPVAPEDVTMMGPPDSDDPMWVGRRQYWADVIANRQGIEVIEK
jgi:hypothetical protein